MCIFTDLCGLPRVVGPCSGSFRQWFYDSRSDRCYEFDYGGCQGNPNRFNNEPECQQRCQRQRPATTAPPVAVTEYVPAYSPPDQPGAKLCNTIHIFTLWASHRIVILLNI